jgi:hypothetical protein
MTYYSIHFNRADFINIQYNLSRLTGDELVIINNGNNENITHICKELDIRCIGVKDIVPDKKYPERIGPSFSHGCAINATLPYIDMSKDWGILDHDMFMIDKIKFDDCDIIALVQHTRPDSSLSYLWPGMILCKGGVSLKDIDFTPIIRKEPEISFDTGCNTHTAVIKYKVDEINIKVIEETEIDTVVENLNNCLQNRRAIAEHIYKNNIIGYHYINGSNWSSQNKTEDKNKMLYDLLFKKFGVNVNKKNSKN